MFPSSLALSHRARLLTASDAEPLLDDVLDAVKTKSFLPRPIPTVSHDATLPSPALSANSLPFKPPTGPAALTTRNQHRVPGLVSNSNGHGEPSRKRKHAEQDPSQSKDYPGHQQKHGSGGERPFKQLARRGGNAFGGSTRQNMSMGPTANGGLGSMSMGSASGFANFPTPAGFPAMDFSDPMSMFAMMQMGLAGMPALTPPGMTPKWQMQSNGAKMRCQNYDTKGFCALGSVCPYEHGGEIVVSAADGRLHSQSSAGNRPERRPPFATQAVDRKSTRLNSSHWE